MASVAPAEGQALPNVPEDGALPVQEKQAVPQIVEPVQPQPVEPVQPVQPQQQAVERDANCCTTCTRAFQRAILGNIEKFFYAYGKFVARRWPFVLVGSILLFLLASSGIGVIGLEQETDQSKQWMADGTDYKAYSNWVAKNYPADTRMNSGIVHTTDGSNILTVDKLRAIWKLRQAIGDIELDDGKISLWSECKKTPLPKGFPPGATPPAGNEDASSDDAEEEEEAEACENSTADGAEQEYSRDEYKCSEMHILALWARDGDFSEDRLKDATDEKVMQLINLNSSSRFLGSLGGVDKDEDGRVTKAEALSLTFFNQKDKDDKKPGDDFEKEYIKVWDAFRAGEVAKENKLSAYQFASISFAETVSKDMGSDSTTLMFGFLLVLIYIMFQLGRFNMVEQRAGLSVCGILAVAMGIGTCYGMCLYFGIMFTTMHSILPFMLLGIGIDDMFVIVQCFDNLSEEEKQGKTLIECFGLAMKHAGVAITITSLTDLLAFSIGASTVLPALSSFCIYAALGIVAVFFYMATFFLVIFTIDQKRAAGLRNACICCYVHHYWIPNECSRKNLMETIFGRFGEFLGIIYVKIGIIVLTCGIVAMAGFGVSQIDTDFKTEWFINEGTYLRSYFEKSTAYFPKDGLSGSIYVGEMDNFHETFADLEAMRLELEKLENNLDTTQIRHNFPYDFIAFVHNVTEKEDFPVKEALAEDEFQTLLRDFLVSDFGKDYQAKLKFQGEFKECEKKAPKLKSFTIHYMHEKFDSAMETIGKMNKVVDSVKEWHKTLFKSKGKVFAYSQQYSNYITMDIITSELIRNILLALVCVFLATVLLIADFIASTLVVVNVMLTLLNVAGFMYWWSLTIDTSAAILLTIAMGLAVDYSAHIAHFFMTAQGTRNERVALTMRKMGPAVFNGGFSTFLAFSLLMTSKTYVFTTFFKIFFLVVAFGLYHGMFVLPVALSFLGPAPIQDFGHGKEEVETEPQPHPKAIEAAQSGQEIPPPVQIQPAWQG